MHYYEVFLLFISISHKTILDNNNNNIIIATILPGAYEPPEGRRVGCSMC